MNSPQWWRVRRAWVQAWRAAHPGGKLRCAVCDRPWSERHDDLHHRSYAHLGYEQLEDLLPMCRPCHQHLHAVLDTSPTWCRADRALATDVIVVGLRLTCSGDDLPK